jgi:hypothetical protein
VASPAAYPEAETFDPPDTAETFSLRAEGGPTVVVHVGARDIVGPDVSLGCYAEPTGTALRGKAVGRPVNVAASARHATGVVGAGPLDLAVAREDDVIHVQGLVGGHPSDFRAGDRAVGGTLGGCSYELVRGGDSYEGRRSCGGPSEQVTLRLPTSLERWSDAERATVLAILLGSS